MLFLIIITALHYIILLQNFAYLSRKWISGQIKFYFIFMYSKNSFQENSKLNVYTSKKFLKTAKRVLKECSGDYIQNSSKLSLLSGMQMHIAMHNIQRCILYENAPRYVKLSALNNIKILFVTYFNKDTKFLNWRSFDFLAEISVCSVQIFLTCIENNC